MGTVFALGVCYSCKQIFGFNPHKVPSLFADGDIRPICRSCVERVNPERVKGGLKPIVPRPGAYEDMDGDEL